MIGHSEGPWCGQARSRGWSTSTTPASGGCWSTKVAGYTGHPEHQQVGMPDKSTLGAVYDDTKTMALTQGSHSANRQARPPGRPPPPSAGESSATSSSGSTRRPATTSANGAPSASSTNSLTARSAPPTTALPSTSQGTVECSAHAQRSPPRWPAGTPWSSPRTVKSSTSTRSRHEVTAPARRPAPPTSEYSRRAGGGADRSTKEGASATRRRVGCP